MVQVCVFFHVWGRIYGDHYKIIALKSVMFVWLKMVFGHYDTSYRLLSHFLKPQEARPLLFVHFYNILFANITFLLLSLFEMHDMTNPTTQNPPSV